MRAYFSTVRRTSELSKAGEFVLVDWDRKQKLAEVVVTPSDPSFEDPNPRGGTRGGRGIWQDGGNIYAASDDRVNIFDLDLAGNRAVSNNLFAGLHEVYLSSPGRLWVTATSLDAALEVDLSTGECVDAYWPREDPRFQAALDVSPLAVDKTADNRLSPPLANDPSHLHLNAVGMWRGELLALFNHIGAIANLERGEVVMRDPLLHRAHNLVVRGDEAFVCSSDRRRVCQVDLAAARVVRVVNLAALDGIDVVKMAKSTFKPSVIRRAASRVGIARPQVVARPLFARGLQVVGDHVFVGIAPASILRIDWGRGALVDHYQHSEQVTSAVHGLWVDPG
jgi:hypothetical protein